MKKLWELTKEESEDLFADAARQAIEETHAAGRPSTHGDESGIYYVYQDGRKEYSTLYENEQNEK